MNKKNIRNIRGSIEVKALFEPHLLTEQGLEQLRQLAPTAKADKIKQAFAEMKGNAGSLCRATHFPFSTKKLQ